MIRLRSTKLLSGVSAVALLTALSAVPARADLTFSGVNLYPPIVNTAETNSILVDTFAMIGSDDTTGFPDQGNSIINEIDMSGTGDKIEINDATLAGGILNRTGVTITSSDAAGILLTNTAVMGGAFINQGNVNGFTNGFEVNNSHVIRGMFNDVGANIIGGTNGVAIINDSTWTSGVSNEGNIAGINGDGLRLAGANTDFAGGIQNFEGAFFTGKGATAAGIDIGFGGPISSFLDDITNEGVIQGLNGGRGIYVNATLFDGNISNLGGGLIQGVSAGAYGIYVFGGAFDGSIDNSGTIQALGAGGQAVVIGGTTAFTGDIVNNDVGQIRAAAAAISVSTATSYLGNINNYGFIESTGGNAIDVSTVSFTGDIFQEFGGTILGAVQGIQISSTGFVGDVENHGSIQGGTDGLRLETGAVMTGNILMSGTIVGVAGDGVRLRGTVSGTLTNLELIQGGVAGISVESAGVAGGILNSGTIVGASQSIDLDLATGATTITQTAGSLQGTLRLNQSGGEQIDTFNADGGDLQGDIDAGGTDNMNVSGGVFAHVFGTASGLDQVTLNSGLALFGTTGFGVDGVGVTYNTTNDMNVVGAMGYLDDDTVINLTNTLNVGSGGALGYFVTSNVAQHGQINATGGANLDGILLAVVDGTTFGSIGGDTFTYANIITGPVSGTFADVFTTSLFFEGSADYHANAVDLILNRLSFNDVLNLGALTNNQLAVGGALEDIYDGGSYGSDMEDLFNYLLSLPGGSEAEVAAIYDELGGAEHAQLQQATLRSTMPFDTSIGDRLDEAKLGLKGSGWAANGERRYADAAQQRMMTDAAPSASSGQGLLRGSSGVSIWGRGYGQWTDVEGDPEAVGYNQDSGGVVGGLDFALGENAIIGGAFGWGTSSVDFESQRDHADIDTFQFGGYGSYGFGRLYADAQVSVAFHDLTTTRELDLGFDTFFANANYNARSFTAAGEIGTTFKLGRVNMQPMVNVNYTSTSTDGFIEAGAGDFGLIVGDTDADSFTTQVGLRASGIWTVGRVKLLPEASIAWRHEFADERQSFTAAFLDDPSTMFEIISSKISPDSAVVGAGMAAGITQGLELFVDYNGLINQDVTAHNGSAGFRATW